METIFLKLIKAYCDVTGLTEELLQTSCFALTDPDDVERVNSIMQEFSEQV